jgi:hypothetical protein
MLRPRAFAAFRLTANSNFVGCSIGKSLGCAPCKILCGNQYDENAVVCAQGLEPWTR